MEKWAIDMYVEIVQIALPVAIVFRFCNLIVTTILEAAFGGRLWFGKR